MRSDHDTKQTTVFTSPGDDDMAVDPIDVKNTHCFVDGQGLSVSEMLPTPTPAIVNSTPPGQNDIHTGVGEVSQAVEPTPYTRDSSTPSLISLPSEPFVSFSLSALTENELLATKERNSLSSVIQNLDENIAMATQSALSATTSSPTVPSSHADIDQGSNSDSCSEKIYTNDQTNEPPSFTSSSASTSTSSSCSSSFASSYSPSTCSSTSAVVPMTGLIQSNECVYAAVPISHELYIIPKSSRGFNWNGDLFLKPHQRRSLGIDHMFNNSENNSRYHVFHDSNGGENGNGSFSHANEQQRNHRHHIQDSNVLEIRLDDQETAGILPSWS